MRTAGPDTIDANINTNLIAPMLLTRAFFEQLPPSTQGCVINMLDQRVTNPTPRYMSYTASKVALEAMTRTWALELAPAVRVNGIAPLHFRFALPKLQFDIVHPVSIGIRAGRERRRDGLIFHRTCISL